jgi:hypothetical protein
MFSLQSDCCHAPIWQGGLTTIYPRCSSCSRPLTRAEILTPCCKVHPEYADFSYGLPRQYRCHGNKNYCKSRWYIEGACLFMDPKWVAREGVLSV